MTLRDWEEMPEEEFDEVFNEILRQIIKQAEEDAKNKPPVATTIMDPKKIQDVIYVYNVMKSLTEGTGANVSYNIDEDGLASVYVTAKNFATDKIDLFLRAASKMPNLDAATKLDGTVYFGFNLQNIAIEYDKDGNVIN